MPLIVKAKTGAVVASKPPVEETKPKLVVTPKPKSVFAPLSLTLSEPVKDVNKLIWLFYGERKIGKTSLAAQFPSAWFAMFEPGGSGLRIRSNEIPNWETFLYYHAEVLKSDIKTVVIDTIDIAYDRCQDWVCSNMGIEHPTDAGYGKGWDAVRKEFYKRIEELALRGRGVVMVSHATLQEFERHTGGTYTKIVPSMGKQAKAVSSGIADFTGYYGYYGEKRYIVIAGSDEIEAGQRLEEQFWVKDKFIVGQYDDGRPKYTGTRIMAIPAGTSAKEAYDNIVVAFNNEQTDSYDVKTRAKLSDTPAPMKRK